MNTHVLMGILSWLMVGAAAVQPIAQTNLVVNGDFADNSGWNDLGQYDGGQATGKIENSAYVIDISAGGNVPWSIQFTQTHITLDSGSVYLLSCDIASTIERTVEISLSRNGGDYASYSGRDTVRISPQTFAFKDTFVMKSQSDRDTRLEFNCGKAAGKIAIRNVRLIKFTEARLNVETPRSGEILLEGAPYSITWSSFNISGAVQIDFSVDNGAHWKTIGSTRADSGSFTWAPGAEYSPWCRIRVSSIADTGRSSLNEGPFECVPSRELIRNSRFRSATSGWNFGVYGGSATGGLHQDSTYRIRIERSADDYWQIQLTQNGISLVNGQPYLLSFTAYGERATNIKINIGMDREPYSSYFDTTKWIVALSTTPTRYTFEFSMNAPDDTNSRVEFNCGRADGDVFIGEISIVPDYIAPVGEAKAGVRHHTIPSRHLYLNVGKFQSATARFGEARLSGPVRMFDLRGRSAGRAKENATFEPNRVPGIYLIDNQRQE